MTEEIHLGVYERLLKDYESDKGKYAADLAYAACCLGDTVTSEEIAKNENTVTFAVGLPLALSGIDEEIWKTYLAKPANGEEKLKEFLEGILGWHRQNVLGDTDDSVKVDYGSLIGSSKFLGDDWYGKFFEWVRFCEVDAVFEGDDVEKCKRDTEKWEKAILPLWGDAKPDQLKILLCLKALFNGNSSLNLEKPSKRPSYTWYLSYNLAKEIVEDSIKSFASEKNLNPFILYMLGISINETDLGELYYEQILKICVNGRLSSAVIPLVDLLDEDEQEYHQEAFKWYEKGAQMGNPYAQDALANLYENEACVYKDLSKAKDWRLKALTGLEWLGNKGYISAMIVIASYYTNGVEGISANASEALKWYKRALLIAEKQSQQEILVKIYDIYSRNQEWKDIRKLESEAQSCDVAAMQAIGDLYLNGDTVPQDLNEACKWYKKASEQLKISFFILAINGYEEYMEGSDYCKLDKAFRLVVNKALELGITHTDEFFAFYRYLPAGQDVVKAIELVHDCFYRYDAKFEEKVKGIIGNSICRHWNTWSLGVREETKEYLKELFLAIKKIPSEFSKFIKNKGGKLEGFGLAQLSQLCVLLRPDFYLVMNKAAYITETVKKDKKLRISDNNYTNYPLLCEKIVNGLDRLGFPSTYLGHVFDRLVCKWAEKYDEILSEKLVENFRTLVSHLLGITENHSAATREFKTQKDFDIERRDLDWDLIFKKFFVQAQEKLEGKYSVNILLDILKERLVSGGYKYDDDIERRFLLWVKRNLPQNPNMKV